MKPIDRVLRYVLAYIRFQRPRLEIVVCNKDNWGFQLQTEIEGFTGRTGYFYADRFPTVKELENEIWLWMYYFEDLIDRQPHYYEYSGTYRLHARNLGCLEVCGECKEYRGSWQLGTYGPVCWECIPEYLGKTENEFKGYWL